MFTLNKTWQVRLLRVLLASGSALAGAVIQPALAAPIVYEFSGTVSSDDANRGWSSFVGSFTFSSAAVDGIADPSTGAYAHAGSPWGMAVVFDGGPAVSITEALHILVTNDLGGSDQLGVLARTADLVTSLSLTLFDYNQAVFANDSLPAPPNSIAWSNFGWGSFGYESTEGYLQGFLTGLNCSSGCESVVPSPVPEPGALWLALAGLAGVHLGSRRVRRRTPDR